MVDRPDRIWNRIFLPLALAVLLLLATVVMYKNNEYLLKKAEINTSHAFRSFKKYPAPVVLPNFKIRQNDQKTLTLKDLKGHYIILNIWATWCAPCVKELPALNRLQMAFPQGEWRVVAVSIDAQKDINKIKNFVTKYHVEDIALYHDENGDLQRILPIKNLPTTFFINKSGKIIYAIEGDALWNDPAVIDLLRKISLVY